MDEVGLRPCDVVSGKNFDLYVRAEAHRKPTSAALVRALREDTKTTKLTWIRLRALAAVTGRAPLPEIERLPIFLVNRRLPSAEGICLPPRGRRRSYWGSWKQTLTGLELTAADSELARRVGVTGEVPTPLLAREYFRFLASAGIDVLRQEQTTVLRHWLVEKDGPLSCSRGPSPVPAIGTCQRINYDCCACCCCQLGSLRSRARYRTRKCSSHSLEVPACS